MLDWLKRDFRRQCFLLLICIALSALFSWTVDLQPRLRMNSMMTIRGIIGGGLIAALSLGLHWGFLFFFPKHHAASIEKILKQDSLLNWRIRTGAALVSAGGEELLLRVFVFYWIAGQSVWLAFFLNALLTFGLYCTGRQSVSYAATKAFEATLFAFMFWLNRSVYMIAVARFVAELLLSYLTTRGDFIKNAEELATKLRGPSSRLRTLGRST